MSQQPRRSVLISQLSILFISLVSTLIPEYSLWVFFIYFIILSILMFRSSRRLLKIPSARELGSPLFKERNALKIAMLDKVLIDELRRQFTSTFTFMLFTLILLLVFPIYRSIIWPLTYFTLIEIIDNDLIVKFIAFLIMYEVFFGVITLIRIKMMGRLTASTILVANTYTLYRSGVVVNDRFYIDFNPNYCYEYDPKRRFIEIRDRKSGSMRIRLYSESISELYDKIKEVKIENCVESK